MKGYFKVKWLLFLSFLLNFPSLCFGVKTYSELRQELRDYTPSAPPDYELPIAVVLNPIQLVNSSTQTDESVFETIEDKKAEACQDERWSRVYEKGDFTYYVLTLNGCDFEFVKVRRFRTIKSGFLGLKKKQVSDGKSDYFMMSTVVTQGHWFAVMGANPACFKGRGLDLPMESVFYNDIVGSFLPKLNNLLKEAGFEGELKLPTDTQWQCMADKNVASDFASNKSKYSDFGGRNDQPLSVKSKAPGNLGARMFGGVWEWVEDPESSGGVAIRGGCWKLSSMNVGPSVRRCSHRPDNPSCYIGFRVLRNLPGQA